MVPTGSCSGTRGMMLLQEFYVAPLEYDCIVVIIVLFSKLS